MTVETLINLITSVGFPTAMTLMLFKFMTNLLEQHKEERKEMMTTIENNTEAINKLSEKLK